jgi:hypothetical protein
MKTYSIKCERSAVSFPKVHSFLIVPNRDFIIVLPKLESVVSVKTTFSRDQSSTQDLLEFLQGTRKSQWPSTDCLIENILLFLHVSTLEELQGFSNDL